VLPGIDPFIPVLIDNHPDSYEPVPYVTETPLTRR
jgi:hypothetical protein